MEKYFIKCTNKEGEGYSWRRKGLRGWDIILLLLLVISVWANMLSGSNGWLSFPHAVESSYYGHGLDVLPVRYEPPRPARSPRAILKRFFRMFFFAENRSFEHVVYNDWLESLSIRSSSSLQRWYVVSFYFHSEETMGRLFKACCMTCEGSQS